MRNTQLDPTRYVDAQAYEKYQRHKGQELVVSECVVGCPSQVFDAWLEEVWLAGGVELHEGEGRGYVGHIRGNSLGAKEEIVSVGLPIDDLVDSDGGRPSLAVTQRDCSKIPSVYYTNRKVGLLPVQNYFAFVQFVDVAASPESTPSTLVIWSLKIEPSVIGYFLFCGGLTKFIMRWTLQDLLSDLAVRAAARTTIPDAASFEAYSDSDGQEFTLAQLVNASVDEAYNAWIQMEWFGRGSTLKAGEGRGFVGHRRLVSLGVEEQILSAGPPDHSNKIASVCYKIQKSGPLLLSDHMSFVEFVADKSASSSHPKTLILWNSKLTPSFLGSVLLCGGSISRLIVRTVHASSLQKIAASFPK